jgi:hypothetical protein
LIIGNWKEKSIDIALLLDGAGFVIMSDSRLRKTDWMTVMAFDQERRTMLPVRHEPLLIMPIGYAA